MRAGDKHAHFRELIAARLDRPLSRIELRSLNAHLKTCAACRTVESDYRAQRAMLRALPQPLPPRDLWARTSASLDREVARGYRASPWNRRLARAGRAGQPSASVMTAVAALGVVAALAVLQLAPAFAPSAGVPGQPTPLAVIPQPLAILGLGPTDISVYRTSVSQVCPATAPIDCVETDKVFGAPLGLPASMRAGNIALSPSGQQLVLVSHYVGHDVISVVMMPPGAADPGDSNAASEPDPAVVAAAPTPAQTEQPGDIQEPASAPSAGGSPGPPASAEPGSVDQTPAPVPESAQPSGVPVSTAPPAGVSITASLAPASAIPGLAVLNILEDVESVGAPPAWSPNGTMIAFSAMPVDGSSGPDVYVWSPGDQKARSITNDHGSFFASWSGNRIVMSRLGGADGRHARTFVIDPQTLEERAVGGPQVWLPVVNGPRTEAVAWYGQLDVVDGLPTARSGALYMLDWSLVDPYGNGAQQSTNENGQQPAAPTEQPTEATPTTQPTAAPDESRPPATDAATETSPAGVASPDATATTDGPASADATAQAEATPSPDPTEQASPTAKPTERPTAEPTDQTDADSLASLVPLEPDRDFRSAPILDWQARWSNDGQVLGVWIADSAGSNWGRLAVLAVDPQTGRVLPDSALLAPTLARRGFSLGISRVAWVGPSDENVDGELRIRTWGTDGIGGLRLRAPGQEELLPAF